MINPEEEVMGLVNQATLVELLRNMVAIPSRNPPGEEKALAEFLAKQAQDWGLEVQLVPAPFPDRPQLVVKLPGTVGDQTLVLNGHLDTVPEMDESRWSVPPFKGVVKDGRLYGRGAADMKAGLAAAFIAARAFKESNFALRGDLIIQCAVGEETGEPGTKNLLIEQGIRGDWAIVLEPTSLRIATATRGVAWYHLNIGGVAGHASRPQDAVNPIPLAGKVVQAIQDYAQVLDQRQHPLLGNPSLTVTVMQCGGTENAIPGNCFLALDRRMIPGETAQQAEEEIRALLDGLAKKDKSLKYDFSLASELGAAEIPSSSQLVRVLSQNFVETFGRPAEIWGTPYGSDMRNFVNDAGMPAVNFGPGSIAQAHAYDEYVEINEAVDCAKLLVAVAVDLLGY